MADSITQTSKFCLPLLPGPPCLPETGSSCCMASLESHVLHSAPLGCPWLSWDFHSPPLLNVPRPPCSRVLEAGLPITQSCWLQAHFPLCVAPPAGLIMRQTSLQLTRDIILNRCEAVLETCGDSAGASHLTSQHSKVAQN